MPRRPDFFIVGAPKSGTTAMYSYLRTHPQLFLPERKELRYFGSDLEIRDRRPLSMDEYLGYFAGAGNARRIGTAYVWYLYSQRAASEIAAFAPEAQIIVMLRNPVEMLHALHGEHLSNGNEDIEDFEQALAAEDDRRRGKRIPAHAHLPQGLWYSSVPRYTEQLERYVSVFGRERLHVVLYDDFAADTPAAYAGTLRFLGVADDQRPAAFDVVNASRRTRSERLRHFLARPPELPRRIIRRTLPGPLRRALYERAKQLNVERARRRPMAAGTRERLTRQFSDEVQWLSGFLDRDLSHWLAIDSGIAEPQASR
jgi:hypothetical protein